MLEDEEIRVIQEGHLFCEYGPSARRVPAPYID